MNRLRHLTFDDILFTNNPNKDRITTKLSLDDYSWMYYTLSTIFYTKKNEIYNVCFAYDGFKNCEMTVSYSTKDICERYEYKYDAEIFEKYIKRFLEEHRKSWDSTYAFNGGDIVLDFYNEVLDNHSSVSVRESSQPITKSK